MPEPRPTLTIAGPPPGRRGGRGPGPGVVVVALYAVLFGAALWIFRARMPLFHRASSPAARAPATVKSHTVKRIVPSRPELLAGAALAPLAREDYFRTLSTECCSCGCEMNLRDCLVSDQKCTVSSDRAAALVEERR